MREGEEKHTHRATAFGDDFHGPKQAGELVALNEQKSAAVSIWLRVNLSTWPNLDSWLTNNFGFMFLNHFNVSTPLRALGELALKKNEVNI